MFKGNWLLLRNHLKKNFNSKYSGKLLLICLLFLSVPMIPLHATTSLTIEHIHKLEANAQGDVKKRYEAWEKLIVNLKDKPVSVQLEQVNAFFNQFVYQTDLESRGVEDYWKSPAEFIEDGGGDCEDYAIIKYFTLLTLGVPDEKLRITYVTSKKLTEAHMVLSYYASPELEPLILDNFESKILPASKRPDLKPVYSFNGSGLWLAKQRDQSKLIGQPRGLNKWDELKKRMQ